MSRRVDLPGRLGSSKRSIGLVSVSVASLYGCIVIGSATAVLTYLRHRSLRPLKAYRMSFRYWMNRMVRSPSGILLTSAEPFFTVRLGTMGDPCCSQIPKTVLIAIDVYSSTFQQPSTNFGQQDHKAPYYATVKNRTWLSITTREMNSQSRTVRDDHTPCIKNKTVDHSNVAKGPP